MRICIIGKQAFGAEVSLWRGDKPILYLLLQVYRQLLKAGHEVVLVCTELDKNGRADLIGINFEGF